MIKYGIHFQLVSIMIFFFFFYYLLLIQLFYFLLGVLKKKTMTIIGYGNIGQSCAKLAKAFGMKVNGIRKRKNLSQNCPYVDNVSFILYSLFNITYFL